MFPHVVPRMDYAETQKFQDLSKIYSQYCWGAIEIMVTNNAPQYLQAAEFLAQKHHIYHIKISPYNSQAQGPI